MPSHPTSPCPLPRRGARLATTLLVVALCALGCGSELAARTLPLRASDDAPPVRGPLDVDDPSIGKLAPDLLDALQAAARDARRDGVRMQVTSGWRSRAHQQRLLDEAVQTYGSEEEARRWVATPDTSAHVTGDAIDVGPADAISWLSQHGTDYGLCQVFANEIWHYELATTPGGQCPEMLPDGTSRS